VAVGRKPRAAEQLRKAKAALARAKAKAARLSGQLAETREQQAATAEILKVISSSPADAQPVFDAIAESSLRLLQGWSVIIWRLEGQHLQIAAVGGGLPGSDGVVRKLFGTSEGVADATFLGDAVRSREPRQILDSESEDVSPRTRETARVRGWRSNVAVPMLQGGNPIGAITLSRAQPGGFAPREIEQLKTFADQAVIAIENVRLFNETKEALEQQRASAEVLNVISNSMSDPKPVFEKIVESCERIFGTSRVGLNLIGPDGLVHAGAYGKFPGAEKLRRENCPHPIPGSATGAAISAGEPIHYPDALGDPDVPQYARRGAETVGFRAFIMAPLLSGERGLGAIFVGRESVGWFSEKERALLKTFADQAVIAIENTRLFNETREALERQTATAEILKVIASSPSDVQPVFDEIVRCALRLIRGGATAHVTRVEGENLHLAAFSKTDAHGAEALARLYPMKVAGTVVGDALVRGEAFVVADAESDIRLTADVLIAMRARGVRSFAAVPMFRSGTVMGTIVVNRNQAGPFDDHEIDSLKVFADQAVIAIENTRLFNETREALERQTATAEILKAIGSSPTDTQPVFDAIVQSGLRLFPEATVAVARPDDDRVYMAAVAHRDPAVAEATRARFPIRLTREYLNSTAILDARLIDLPDAALVKDGPFAPGILNFLASGNRAMTVMPMIHGGKAIGAISVARTAPGPLSDKQLALLRIFADQAVIAIENVRLFKELQDRTEALSKSVQQLIALGEVGQAISSTLDLDEVLKAIVSRAVQLSGLDAGVIYEYDQQNDTFQLRASERFDESGVSELRGARIRRGEGAVGRCVETREPTQVPDTHAPDYPAHLRELLDRNGLRALLAVPLLREDHIIGALMVIRRSPGAFATEIVDLLKTFAGQSALAIQNARLFREIAEKSRQLEEASKHKSQFLASMSHELRTPLNAILGFNEMILGEIYGAVPPDMKGPLEDIQSSGKHLLRLINNVLDLAKIEAGRMELALADYSVHDTVETVRSTLRPLAAEKGLEFAVTLPGDIPLAYGDSGRITQCLVNLAGNSLKFTKSGKVEIAVEHQGDLLKFSVADTGIGIAPDKIGSLFTEFKQTDATIASEYGGSGLGLSIVKKFVEMHGGRIWVESELGKGSTFAFEIPLRAKEGAAA
jgi:GAF domain-containing protein